MVFKNKSEVETVRAKGQIYKRKKNTNMAMRGQEKKFEQLLSCSSGIGREGTYKGRLDGFFCRYALSNFPGTHSHLLYLEYF